MFGINYKMWISENAEKKKQEYIKKLNTGSNWGEVAIGYCSPSDVSFDKFYAEGICNHPKMMYRPGHTVICHFVPILPELVKKHETGEMRAEDWEALCLDTRQISRGITDAITSTLQSFGREVSLLSELENWSQTCGAEAADLGKFEKRQDMYCDPANPQILGSIGAVVTEQAIH